MCYWMQNFIFISTHFCICNIPVMEYTFFIDIIIMRYLREFIFMFFDPFPQLFLNLRIICFLFL